MAKAGDIIDLTFNNAEVGSGRLRPKSGEGNTYDPGGIRVADDQGSITTDGTLIVTKNRKAGMLQVLLANDMNLNKDIEKLAALAKSLADTTWTFTVINGITYRGKGEIVGDIVGDIDKATVPLKIVFAELKQL